MYPSSYIDGGKSVFWILNLHPPPFNSGHLDFFDETLEKWLTYLDLTAEL